MPITMRWADERKNIFIFDMQAGNWNWRQYDDAVVEAIDCIKAVDHDIAVILLSAPAVPEGSAITHLLRAVRHQPDHLKLYIIVGGDAFIRLMNNILIHIYPKTRIIFANSEAEAYKLAADHGF